MEVPELASGAIEIKGLAREPGSRTKIAIASNDPHVDPVGSLVGQRGVRVSTVMAALGGERIDIIEWSEDQAAYIKESLSPATVIDVELDEEGHRAAVTVTEDQQSLAIGRGGQNVRLAAKLTGWNIDIMAVGGTNVAESEAPAEAAPEGASDESVAAIDDAEDTDPAVAAGIDPTESESVITEDDQADGALTVEEETSFDDNGPVADAEEARDEKESA
jgi:N utilization substance protein A